jgi:hypothetical protein
VFFAAGNDEIGELVQAFEDLAKQADPFRYPLFRLRPRR